ncbi:hypothetical protein IW140_003811 [Coemansia sp. RSA 1813]|nr:hypothetical protein IW140_003811 [Coemansia sp. RSA 1813]
MCCDADDGKRISIGLELKPIDTAVYPENANQTAEVTKKHKVKVEIKHADLLLIYETQRNRRFVDLSSTLKGLFPYLEAGGRVRFNFGSDGGASLDDTTTTILRPIGGGEIDEIHVRIHKRIEMSPLGRPLQELKSVYELVIVIAAAMRYHSAIIDHCDILHRDSSPNNIMFARNSSGMVHEMLIDFNHAIKRSAENGSPHAERTGTLPFMSASNLNGCEHRRTALDDWELRYILIDDYTDEMCRGALKKDKLRQKRLIHLQSVWTVQAPFYGS